MKTAKILWLHPQPPTNFCGSFFAVSFAVFCATNFCGFLSLRRLGTSPLDPRSFPPPLPNPGYATASVLFRRKNYAKMSVFLVINLKIRGAWGLCPHTPLASAAGGFAPLNPRLSPLTLPNPGCATGYTYEVLPFPEILGWLRHWFHQ